MQTTEDRIDRLEAFIMKFADDIQADMEQFKDEVKLVNIEQLNM
jgi:hypothetical protein